jgi:hypothetical protein
MIKLIKVKAISDNKAAPHLMPIGKLSEIFWKNRRPVREFGEGAYRFVVHLPAFLLQQSRYRAASVSAILGGQFYDPGYQS